SDQSGDQGSPAGLVARPKSLAGVAVKILMEGTQIAPVRILAIMALLSVPRPPAFFVRKEDRYQPAANLSRHFLERPHLARAGRTFDLKLAAIEMMITLERLYQQIIE